MALIRVTGWLMYRNTATLSDLLAAGPEGSREKFPHFHSENRVHAGDKLEEGKWPVQAHRFIALVQDFRTSCQIVSSPANP